MNYHFYENKIIYILMSALVLIQLAAFFTLKHHNQSVIQTIISKDLTNGANVFKRILEARHQQLTQSAEVLVSDYGFRQSIASNDIPTIESTLTNHGFRVDANLLMLSNLEHEVIAATPESLVNTMLSNNKIRVINESLGKNSLQFLTLTVPEDVPETETNITPKSTNKLFQLVSANITSPLKVATLTVGYVVDNNLALDLKSVTDMELLFFSKRNQQWVLHASSMPHDQALKLSPPSLNSDSNGRYSSEINGQHFLAVQIKLSQDSADEIVVITAKSLDKLVAPFKEVERMFMYLLIATIFLSVVAIYIVTHKMVRPLNDFAHLDNLTNIGNRRLFNTILDNAFVSLNERNKPFAMLMLDLNKFKQINDTYGHDAGDIVLKETAKRLKLVMRNSDNVVRLGGDEFAIIVHDGCRSGLILIAEKIHLAITQPIQIVDAVVDIGTSIGIVIAPLHAKNKNDMIKFADIALYISKTKKMPYHFYGDQGFDIDSNA